MSEELARTNRKEKKGTVLSSKMDKTVIVSVKRTLPHPKYGKVMNRQKKYYAHHDSPLTVGDSVTIVETRPLSKTKRWRVVEEKAKG